MRIFLFAEYYPNYLDSFYKRNDLSNLGYKKHLEVLLQDYFGSFGSYRNYFNKLGHEACLVIGNDRTLQAKWLKERGMPAYTKKEDVVLAQVREFMPDVFFTGSMFGYYGNFMRQVSQVTKNIFVWIGCPYPRNLDLSNISCVISGSDEMVSGFREDGINSELMRTAFDADIIQHLDNQKNINVSFLGGMSKKTHSRRVMGLEHLLKSGIDMQVFGYGLRKSFFPFLNSPLVRVFGGERWGLEMYKTLNNSKISLNFHIDIAKGFSGNMRLFEATGCGSLLMTENTPDIHSDFKVGEEIVAYDNFDDLVDKIKYFLAHEKELESIAKAGQKACIERHGYDRRIKEFERILFKYC